MRIVNIENTWDRDITIPHLGNKYVIKPGESKIVEFEAAASLFGDPRARNDGKSRGRHDLYDQIRLLWSFYTGFDSDEVWEKEKCPQFIATDVNTKDRIWFVIHDLEGTKTFTMADPTSAAHGSTDTAVLNSAIAEMQGQIAQLVAALAASQAQTATPGTPGSHSGVDTVEPTVIDAVTSLPVSQSDLPPMPPTVSKVSKDGPRATPARAGV